MNIPLLPVAAGAVLALAVFPICAAQPDLRVLRPEAAGTAPGRQLELWLKRELDQAVERRSAAFEKVLKSEAAMRAWQAERKAFFLDALGGLPERTPLNPRVVARRPGPGYILENILFESRPGHHVTANLYLPEGSGPWPGVIIPCGHSHDGKAAAGYQRMAALLARHGMAALCYDPIGQGERYQMLDLSREHKVFPDAPRVPVPHPNVHVLCTAEHTMIGVGSILLGSNVAQYRVWDGMRAIDYLQSRPDIRGDRIGCTGNSGGGTLTAYLMALDDRILAAAPVCYLTTFRRLIHANGAQDAEQNLFGQLAFGLDQADYPILRAPRPTLIGAGTRDATFDFRGTAEVFIEAKRFYSRLGRPETIDLAAPDAPHGFTLQLREAAARWMHRWLIGGDKLIRERDGLPDRFTDDELRAFGPADWTQEQLQCTPRGQVLLLPGERSVFAINAAAATALREARRGPWAARTDADRRALVARTIGARAPGAAVAPRVEEAGETEVRGRRVRKLVLRIDEGLTVPALAFLPARPAGRVTLYLHGTAMAADAGPGGPIDQLLESGHVVLSAELRGIGETETGHDRRDYGYGRFGRDNQEIFLAYLLGRSFVGMRADDVGAWAAYAAGGALTGGVPAELNLIAQGEAAVPALHAAALQPARFRSVALRGMIPSWEAVVAATETFDQMVNTVHGALRHYDLPDLVALAGPGRVTVTAPADPAARPSR